MRKLMKNALIKKSYMSFLEVAQQEPCEYQGSVHVIIKEKYVNDNPCVESFKRYVKLCGASCDDKIYEVFIDENTHSGELKIENVEEGQISLIQVDACGQQVINGEDFCITYYVNDKKSLTDYAEFTLDDTSQDLKKLYALPCVQLNFRYWGKSSNKLREIFVRYSFAGNDEKFDNNDDLINPIVISAGIGYYFNY